METTHDTDAHILLAHITGKSREWLFAHPEFRPTFLQRPRLSYLFKKRQRGVPLAYLTGHKEFYGLDFIVNKHTLIPRPETELMVNLVVQHVETQDFASLQSTDRVETLHATSLPVTLIDVGTGTGCIPIAIMKTLQQHNITTLATDISKSALRAAKKNAKRHNVNLTFLQGNLLEPIIRNSEFLILNSYLVITANLPYLTAEQFNSEPSIQHEPRSALIAEKNGLALYEKLLQQINSIIPQFYNSLTSLFFEIDSSQSLAMRQLILNYFPHAAIEIKTDLRKQDRVVVVKL